MPYAESPIRADSCKITPVPQNGSSTVPVLAPLVARLMRIWASLGGNMPTKASRAGRLKSRLAYEVMF